MKFKSQILNGESKLNKMFTNLDYYAKMWFLKL